MSEIEAGAVVQIDGGEERGKILKRVGSWWHIKMEGAYVCQGFHGYKNCFVIIGSLSH